MCGKVQFDCNLLQEWELTSNTFQGGLKAVIWTDVIQSFVMYGSILAVCIKGTLDVGGLGVVLQRNEESGRLNAPE